ncbi:MAG: LysM peptidoglycan-binding domain-containing protein [Treponema sp.]|nr:LysM peptidoglycan-binding domain-containing protein [Treponema sp.]
MPLFVAAFLVLSLPGAFGLPEGQNPVFFETPAPAFSFAFLPEPFLFLPLASLAAVETDTPAPVIPESIRNNQYYRESLRLTNLAKLSYTEGDYDASANYATEAVRYAQLSDEYVELRLKMKEANDAIAAAKVRLDWASSVNAARRYPREFGEAANYYNTSLDLRKAEDWDGAAAAAYRVIDALAQVKAEEPAEEPVVEKPVEVVVEKPVVQEPPPPEPVVEKPVEVVVEKPVVQEPPPPEPVPQEPEPVLLPAQYTVRPWSTFRDCLWNIAGRPWIYGDPTQWRLLYNANKSKMPNPDNPDLIEPGMVLDIPSIRGEERQGLWDAEKTYPSLR